MSDDVIDAAARGLYAHQCEVADADERREGREPPEKWADPWQPHGIRQRELLYAKARAAIAALHAAGYRIVPYEPSEAMLRAAVATFGGFTEEHRRWNIYNAMLDAAEDKP